LHLPGFERRFRFVASAAPTLSLVTETVLFT